MNADDFENQLRRRPWRGTPPEWRPEILARATAESNRRSIARPQRTSWLRGLLWPSPRAWAGLAALWVLIFVLNGASPSAARDARRDPAPVSRELRVAFQERRRLMTELVGGSIENRVRPVGPRSEYRGFIQKA
jgi:hypothetical protein